MTYYKRKSQKCTLAVDLTFPEFQLRYIMCYFIVFLFSFFCAPLIVFPASSAFLDQMLRENYPDKQIFVYVQNLYQPRNSYSYDPDGLAYRYFAPGSLIKPFSLIALPKSHPLDPMRIIDCKGYDKNTPDEERCLLKEGHGKINLIQAIAHSCNFYFYTIMKDCPYPLFISTLREWSWVNGEKGFVRRYLNVKDQNMTKIGRQYFLQNRPVDVISSYKHLFNHEIPLSSELRDILYQGMRLSFIEGTASKSRKKLGIPETAPVMTKTGTGFYVFDGQYDIHKTNGFFVALYQQHILIFTMILDGTGTEDASLLGLRVLRLFSEPSKTKR